MGGMRYRRLGGTGITVSAIGFGAWGIGGHTDGGRSYGHTDDAVSLAALDAAFDAGITFYDTAPLYGLGHSETLIGRAFAGRRDRVVIASKAGYRDFTSGQDFTPDGVRRSVEDSLRRLGSDYLDVLQLHDLPPGHTRMDELLDALGRLQESGKVRCCGVSAKSPQDALALIAEPLFRVVQVNFNMLDARALECGLLKQAAEKGVGVIARTPLCFGFATGALTGDETFAPEDHRSAWPPDRLRAWADGARRMQAIAGAEGEDDGAARALRYVLSFDAVSVTIPGILTPGEAIANAAAGACDPYPSDVLAAMVACSRAVSA